MKNLIGGLVNEDEKKMKNLIWDQVNEDEKKMKNLIEAWWMRKKKN